MPQPLAPGEGRDPFEVLQVPRRFAQDRAALQRRLLELSRALHPDRFARSGEMVRQASLDRMGLVNESHRLLVDRDAIRNYLFRQAGLDGKPVASPEDLELAERWFELQEQVTEMNDPGPALVSFLAELKEWIADVDGRIRELEGAFDRSVDTDGGAVDARKALEEMSAAARRGNTLRSMVRDVERLMARMGQAG